MTTKSKTEIDEPIYKYIAVPKPRPDTRTPSIQSVVAGDSLESLKLYVNYDIFKVRVENAYSYELVERKIAA